MPTLNLDFKTKLDYKNLATHDIAALDVAINIASEAAFVVESVTFHIILQELDAAGLYDEDIDVFADALMFPNNDSDGQQSHINAQIPQLPFEVIGEKTMDFEVQTIGANSRHRNFLDIIKSIPDHLLKKEPKLELYIACILNKGSDSELEHYDIYTINNPFCAISDNFRKWRLD
jgi:hypothetical protein